MTNTMINIDDRLMIWENWRIERRAIGTVKGVATLREMSPGETSPVQVQLPILLAGHEGSDHDAGLVATMTLRRVPQGIGALYPNPLTMAFANLAPSFHDALVQAWEYSQRTSDAPAASAQKIDIVWELILEGPERLLPIIAGDSAGAALVVALSHLLDPTHHVPLDRRVALTGSLMDDGRIGSVGGYEAKFRAASRHRLIVLVPAADFLDTEQNPTKELKAARARFPLIRIIPVATVASASQQMSNLMDAYRTYLQRVLADANRVPLLERMPELATLNVRFAEIHQPARVSQRRLHYRVEEASQLESLRRAGDIEAADALQLYDWHGQHHYDEQLGAEREASAAWEDVRGRVTRAVLLADPGMGKTVLLKMEAHRVAAGQLSQMEHGDLRLDEPEIPILLRCDALARELTRGRGGTTRVNPANTQSGFERLSDAIIDAVEREYHSAQLPDGFWSWLRGNIARTIADRAIAHESIRCHLLLDGLDEVHTGRAPLMRALRAIPAEMPALRILLTSRIVGYGVAPIELNGSDRQREFELITLTPDDVQDFVMTWFKHDPTRGRRLLDRISTSQGGVALAGLARIPLMLTFLCQLASTDQALPGQRSRLYQMIIELLLRAPHRDEVEDLSETLRDEVVEKKLAVLEKLAWHIAEPEGRWLDALPRRDLVRLLSEMPEARELQAYLPRGRSLLTELCDRDGIMTRLGVGSLAPYGFIHRSLQEYLVARYLSRSGVDWEPVVAKHRWFSPDWVEPISLLAGCLASPTPLLQFLIDTSDDCFHEQMLLAGRCLAETSVDQEVDHLQIQTIVRTLILLLRSRSWLDDQRIRRTLVRIGPRVLPFLPTEFFLDSTIPARIRGGAARVLGACGGQDSARLLEPLLGDGRVDRQVLGDVVWALGQVGGGPGTRGLVAVLADDEVDSTIRGLAAESLAWIGTGQAENGFDDASDEAVQGLAQILRTSGEPYLVHQVARRLGEIGGPLAVVELSGVLADPTADPVARSYAFETLAQLPHDLREAEISTYQHEILDRLVATVEDAELDELTRYEAAGSIGVVGEAMAVEQLSNVMAIAGDEGDPVLAGSAIMALGQIGGANSVAILEEVFHGPGLVFDILYEWAADALGTTGDDLAITALERVVQDEGLEPAARFQAARVVGSLGRQSAVLPLESALRDPQADAEVLLTAARALSGLRTSSVARALEGATAASQLDPFVRAEALTTIGAYRSVDSATVLSVADSVLNDTNHTDVERYELLIPLTPLIFQASSDTWRTWQTRLAMLTATVLEPDASRSIRDDSATSPDR